MIRNIRNINYHNDIYMCHKIPLVPHYIVTK